MANANGPLGSDPAGPPASRGERLLFADHEKMAVILRVDPPVAVQRSRRVSRAQSKLLEYLPCQNAALPYGIEISILAVGVDYAIGIHYNGIYAPLKSIWMIGNAGNRAVGIARAALGIRVLKNSTRDSNLDQTGKQKTPPVPEAEQHCAEGTSWNRSNNFPTRLRHSGCF
jgi:hypothetical protein